MEVRGTSAVLLAVLCVGIGAGGVYLAVRGNPRSSSALRAPVARATTDDTVEPARAARAPTVPGGDAARTPVTPTPATTRERGTHAPAPLAAAPSPPDANAEGAERTALPSVVQPVRTLDAYPSLPEEPPEPPFEELVVSEGSVIGLRIGTSLSSDQARVEDPVFASVTRDVRVGERIAIPAGAKAEGEVTLVELGGRLRDRARLGVRFTSIVLGDGTRVPIETEPIYREGDAPGAGRTARIGGGALGGAIIGGILGGTKGALIGGSAGAGAGTAAVAAGGRNPATLPSGASVTIRLTQPAAVEITR